MSTTTLSITEARNNLLDLIRKTKDLMERVIITKNGKPEAVLISYDEYESWIETLEITQDSQLMKEITEAKEDIKAGRLVPYDEVLKSLKRKKAGHK